MRQQPRIVIMDDDPDVIDRLTQLLEDDYDVRATSDWADLSNLVLRQGCDLVLMDVNLPVLQGDQLVRILSGTSGVNPEGRRAKLYYYSSDDEEKLRRLVTETGADGYLSKSLRLDELVRRIEDLIG